jgi:hypothetical protein
MHPSEVLIPIVFFLSMGAVWGAFILTRHRERVNMIEKGLKAEEIKSLYERQTFKANPLFSLKWGIVLICVGIAIMLGIWLRENYIFNDGIIPGMIATFGGLGLVLFYFIASKKAE